MRSFAKDITKNGAVQLHSGATCLPGRHALELRYEPGLINEGFRPLNLNNYHRVGATGDARQRTLRQNNPVTDFDNALFQQQCF